MTDVFISYSRRDKVFTQKLVDALKSANREVWADWDSIPAASDWDAEIKEGIEKTNTVLFVLSPEWIKSNECRKEMIHAIQHGKRLVPILLIMPDPGQEVPPELAKINWVYMRETDDFEKAFGILQSAMDTDLDWIKTHTRVQVRAIEWDKKKRDNSFTLRGKDLTDGEQFISGAAGKSPEPTPLQGEYVFASRKDATRRQRITLAGVTVALVVSVALGIVAYFQRQAAILNAQISFARELIAASESNIASDPERSLLLALQSIQTTSNAGQDVLPSAEDALRNAIQSSRVRHVITFAEDSITAVAFSPDGKFVAIGTGKGKLTVWRIFNTPQYPNSNGGSVGSFWLEEIFSTLETNNTISSVSFSPDGTLLVTSNSENGMPSIWNIESGDKVADLSGEIGYINKVAFSPNGLYIASGGADGFVRVWDVATASQISINSDQTYNIAGISFSPDGKVIASSGESGRVILSSTENGATIYSYEGEPYQLTSIAFSPRGDLLAFGSVGFNLKVLDLNTESVLNTKFHKEIVSDLTFSPDGSLVVSTGLDGKGIAIDPYTGKRVFVLSGDTSDMLSVAFSPDNQFIATGNQAGEFKIWDASIIPPSEAGIVASQNQPFTGLGIFSDGNLLITSGDEPSSHLYNVQDQSTIKLYNSTSWINDTAISPDQKLVALSDETGVISIWDTTTGNEVTEFSSNTASVYDIEFSPDGSFLSSASDFAYIWDLSSGQLVNTFDTGKWNRASTFTPAGNLLAVGDDSGGVTLFDVQSATQLWKSNLHTATIRSLAFTPNGTELVSGAFDSEAILWDVETGNEIRRFSGHVAGITNVAISPDGTLLATSSSDSTVKVWELSTGNLLYTHTANKFYEYFWVNNVAFSSDGKLLATGSEDGVVRFYFTSIDDLLKLAYSRITRSLTQEECQIYLHVETCPDNLVQPEKPSQKPEGMTTLIPIPPVETIKASDPNFKTSGTQNEIYVDIRNKSTLGITIFWVNENGEEQILGTLAPSEVLRFSSWEGHAYRLKDPQNLTVMEYITTAEAYQQINVRTLSHIPAKQVIDESTSSVIRINYKNEDDTKTGYFLSEGASSWFEKNSDGNFAFTETERTDKLITLQKFDGVTIIINIDKGVISIFYPGTNINSTADLVYLITSVEGTQPEINTETPSIISVTETVGLSSGSGSQEVVLKITNNTNTSIFLTWMDFEGNENAFYTLSSGEFFEQGTLNTHAWRLRDADGNLLFEYVATEQPVQEIIINSDLSVTAQ